MCGFDMIDPMNDQLDKDCPTASQNDQISIYSYKEYIKVPISHIFSFQVLVIQ